MSNVSDLGPSENFKPEQAIRDVLKRAKSGEIQDVVICGWDCNDEFFLVSSKMSRAESFWLSEVLKDL